MSDASYAAHLLRAEARRLRLTAADLRHALDITPQGHHHLAAAAASADAQAKSCETAAASALAESAEVPQDCGTEA